jgi:ABC-type phosphate/phosphonate transport system substrate-binding protein
VTAAAAAPVAALQMYDFPELRAETDALWAALRDALRAAGVAAPEALSRPDDYASVWREPGLVLAQTCGYPYVTALRGATRLLATPVYAAEGCEGPRYRSALIARAGEGGDIADFRGRVAAVNHWDSQSGMNAFRAAVAPLAGGRPFFARALHTGGHRASVAAVREGRADIAAIDAVSWALIGRVAPAEAEGLAVLGFTEAVPALPFVAAAGTPPETLAATAGAIRRVFSAPETAAIRVPLLIAGAEILDERDYDAILAMALGAARAGYPALA